MVAEADGHLARPCGISLSHRCRRSRAVPTTFEDHAQAGWNGDRGDLRTRWTEHVQRSAGDALLSGGIVARTRRRVCARRDRAAHAPHTVGNVATVPVFPTD